MLRWTEDGDGMVEGGGGSMGRRHDHGETSRAGRHTEGEGGPGHGTGGRGV